MARLNIQTGWGAELSAQACACFHDLQEAEDILLRLELHPALQANRGIWGEYRRLLEEIRSTQQRVQAIERFLQDSMEQYEQLEMRLVRQAQELGAGGLSADTAHINQLERLFQPSHAAGQEKE